MVKLQSRLERRLPTGCIEIPVASPGIRVFVHVVLGPFAPSPTTSSRSIIFVSSLWRDVSWRATEAGDGVKGENAW